MVRSTSGISPSPDVVVRPLATDAFGSVTLNGIWPPGVPSGTGLILQSWASHPSSGPLGLAGPPGLEAITP